MEKVVENAAFKESASFTLMRRFTLPGEKAHDLLWLLKREGVSASSVWPGYQGVADELKETFLWKQLADRSA